MQSHVVLYWGVVVCIIVLNCKKCHHNHKGLHKYQSSQVSRVCFPSGLCCTGHISWSKVLKATTSLFEGQWHSNLKSKSKSKSDSRDWEDTGSVSSVSFGCTRHVTQMVLFCFSLSLSVQLLFGLLITLIRCLKGHRSLGLLYPLFFQQYGEVSYSLWTAKVMTSIKYIIS